MKAGYFILVQSYLQLFETMALVNTGLREGQGKKKKRKKIPKNHRQIPKR